MNRFMFVFLLCISAPALAYAQMDAGVGSGASVPLGEDPPPAHGSLVDCITLCNERHPMCVSTHDVEECLANIPECQNLATSDSSVISAFCAACGEGADGCRAPAAPRDAGPPMSSPSTGAALAYESTPEDEPAAETADATPTPLVATPPPPAEHHGAHHDDRPPRPPPVRTVEDLCRVAGGIWDPDFEVIQSRPPTASVSSSDELAPHEGETVRGVCWTREGEVLARRMRTLESELEGEREASEEADRLHDDHLSRHDDDIIALQRRTGTILLHLYCLESHAEFVPRGSVPEADESLLAASAESVSARGYECPARHDEDRPAVAAASAASTGPTHTVYRSSRPGIVGFRFTIMPGFGFQPLTAEQTIESPVPFYLMGEMSLTASVGGDWFLDGGLAFGYPFPDYHGHAMIEGFYHLGFLALIQNTVAVGFGGSLQERYTDVIQSMHTVPGGYVEVDYNLRRGGWQPYIGIRVDLGVGLRPDYNPVLDGSAFLMLGIAHLDAEDGNVTLPDCDTEYCEDTPVGRIQLP